MRATPELEDFIRRTLGCGCPDEVFEQVSVTREPLRPGDPGSAWWIDVGGRLLVAVAEAQPGLAERIPAICAAACARRDASGFNRFRLVVAGGPGPCDAPLEAAFAPLGAADDRLHLHLVAAATLPPLAVTETAPA